MLKADAMGPNVPAMRGKAVDANHHRLHHSRVSYMFAIGKMPLWKANGLFESHECGQKHTPGSQKGLLIFLHHISLIRTFPTLHVSYLIRDGALKSWIVHLSGCCGAGSNGSLLQRRYLSRTQKTCEAFALSLP